jgi:hypothetical protein
MTNRHIAPWHPTSPNPRKRTMATRIDLWADRLIGTTSRRTIRARFGPSVLEFPDRKIAPLDHPDARANGDLYALISPISFRLADGWELFIPEERCYGGGKPWQCDGVSIPRWLWSLLGVRPGGRVRLAAIWHNWLYYNCGYVCVRRLTGGFWEYEWRNFTKTQCDVMFLEWMVWAGVQDHRSIRCFLGVYLFARKAWNAHKRRIAWDRQLDEIEFGEAGDG